MDPIGFAKAYPRLFHVSLMRNQRLIARYGLRSATTLLNLADPAQASRRRSLESSHRPNIAELPLTDGTKAYLRHNLPVNDKQLRKLVEPGFSLEKWYALLNARVFFWLKLDTALAYAASDMDHDQTLYAIDTAKLLAAHPERAALSEIDSSTTKGKTLRGPSTFVPFAAAPDGGKYIEVAVEGEIPDAMALCLERWSIVDGKVVAKIAAEPS